ncbi:MAG TPA: hypothetical protein VJ904_14635 [Tichowtungia sp.]|nr:hypothetical protein [Tichowtungia sp.]
MSHVWKVIWIGAAGVAGIASAQHVCEQGHVHEKNAPYLAVHTDARLYGEQVYSADDPEEEIFNLKTHTHINLEFSPVESLFIRSKLKLEQKHSHNHGGGGPGPDGKDTYFENHLLMIEELKLVYAPGPWEVFAGKFNPVAGLDQHDIPGWYGYEIEEEYSILGRLGAGAAYTFETETLGSHRLETSGFFRDTTVLNQTLFNSAGEPDSKSDGGVANTHDFTSWAVSLSGDPLYTLVGDTAHQFSYVIACARQNEGAGSDPDHDDEERVVAGGIYTVTLTENLALKGVGEYKDIRNHHTHGDNDLRISTAGAELSWRGWELGGSYSVLDHTEEPDGENIQASLGYVFPNGLGVHGGWKLMEEEDEQKKSIGFMVSYHGHF